MSKNKPIAVFGYVYGEKRYETINEWLKPPIDPNTGLELVNTGPLHGEKYFPGGFVFWDRGVYPPSKTFQMIMPHQQKRSKWGFLCFIRERGFPWPTFHFWFHWHMQEGEFRDSPDRGGKYWYYKPNTERGIYIRTPGYRMDIMTDEGMIRTNGYFGGHWD